MTTCCVSPVIASMRPHRAVEQNADARDVGPGIARRGGDELIVNVPRDLSEILPGEDDFTVRADGRERCARDAVDDLPVAGRLWRPVQNPIPRIGRGPRECRDGGGVRERERIDGERVGETAQGGGVEHQPPLT